MGKRNWDFFFLCFWNNKARRCRLCAAHQAARSRSRSVFFGQLVIFQKIKTNEQQHTKHESSQSYQKTKVEWKVVLLLCASSVASDSLSLTMYIRFYQVQLVSYLASWALRRVVHSISILLDSSSLSPPPPARCCRVSLSLSCFARSFGWNSLLLSTLEMEGVGYAAMTIPFHR